MMAEMRRAPVITLNERERATLQKLAQGRRTPARLVLRAKIVLLAADGCENRDIAAQIGATRQTVGQWRERYREFGLAGIEKDAPRGGRPANIRSAIERQIIDKTTREKPRNATHWTSRTLAREIGTSHQTIQRVWKANGLKPHRTRSFKLSNDPDFEAKLIDVVGLYLNPPERALVFSADEKSQIQALDRTQPGLPLKRGRCGTLTHDYKRNGTTTLFAAMEILEGKVISQCMARHRHQEWLRFLRQIDHECPEGFEIHLILDNYATHKHPNVLAWLKRHPRFHCHFIPTSSSWLNIIERFFRELTSKRVRRGSFGSVAELVRAICDYIEQHNENPLPFVWTAEADKIISKVGRAKAALISQQQTGPLH
jgi:transposase